MNDEEKLTEILRKGFLYLGDEVIGCFVSNFGNRKACDSRGGCKSFYFCQSMIRYLKGMIEDDKD